MADIQLTCPACGRLQTVSEFVEERVIACPACGQAMVLPERQPRKTGLELKRRGPPRPSEPAGQTDDLKPWDSTVGVPTPLTRLPKSARREMHRTKMHKLKVRLSVLVFLVLTGGLVYIRFYGGWPGLPLETFELYGLLAIAAAYLFIIGLALRDNMFDGLLAIVVPLYPFYYLFFLSSAVFTRALVGALLAAFGYDTLLHLQGWAAGVVNAVNYWIRHVA